MSGIGDRMKNNYELPYLLTLPARMPVIIRLDGKTFHSFTRGMDRPFDKTFSDWMREVTVRLVDQVQGCVFAYSQSDEISLLLHNYKRLESQSWLANELQKMVSVSAGIASAWMTNLAGRVAVFDSRVFVIPEAEVCNYFIWRQQDASRNSVQMVARALYSHKQLFQKNTSELQEMIFQKGENWNEYPTWCRRGFAVYRVEEGGPRVDLEVPIFTQERAFVEQHLLTDAQKEGSAT